MAYIGFCAYASALGFIDKPLDLADPLAFYFEDEVRAKKTVAELVDKHPLLGSGDAWHANS